MSSDAVVSKDAPAGGGSRHRERLLAGMATAVREKGFHNSTLADVVRHAGVSRRTFYEHFADPTDCYLALIEQLGDQMLAAVAGAMASAGTLPERIDRAVGVYLDMFAADPALSRSYWTEASFTGRRGLQLSRRMSERTGRLIHELAEDARRDDPSVHELSRATGIMIAAGIRELAMLADSGAGDLVEVRTEATELLRRALGA